MYHHNDNKTPVFHSTQIDSHKKQGLGTHYAHFDPLLSLIHCKKREFDPVLLS